MHASLQRHNNCYWFVRFDIVRFPHCCLRGCCGMESENEIRKGKDFGKTIESESYINLVIWIAPAHSFSFQKSDYHSVPVVINSKENPIPSNLKKNFLKNRYSKILNPYTIKIYCIKKFRFVYNVLQRVEILIVRKESGGEAEEWRIIPWLQKNERQFSLFGEILNKMNFNNVNEK